MKIDKVEYENFSYRWKPMSEMPDSVKRTRLYVLVKFADGEFHVCYFEDGVWKNAWEGIAMNHSPAEYWAYVPTKDDYKEGT